jgi:hypothetical protein
MGRPPTRPKRLKDGFYIEVRSKGANTGMKIRSDDEAAMNQAAAFYARNKEVIVLGEHKNDVWLNEAPDSARNKKSSKARRSSKARKEPQEKRPTSFANEPKAAKEPKVGKEPKAKKSASLKKAAKAPAKKAAKNAAKKSKK